MITLKKRSQSTPEICQDFYTQEKFKTDSFVYELSNGFLVCEKTAHLKGFSVDENLQLPEGIHDINQLSNFLVGTLKMKPYSAVYRSTYKRYQEDLIRPNVVPQGAQGAPEAKAPGKAPGNIPFMPHL